MATRVWGDSVRPRTWLIIAAGIVAVPLGCAALLGRAALIAMSVIVPVVVVRFIIELWISEQRKKRGPINAPAIQKWIKFGCWAYIVVALAAVVAVNRLWPGMLD